MTALPGDGVGPELFASIKEVFTASRVPVDFEEMILRYIVPQLTEQFVNMAQSLTSFLECVT